MATDWESTYRRFTDAELAAEITRLDALRTKTMSSQGVGNRNFSRDLSRIDDQYRAAIKERGDRSGTVATSAKKTTGVIDYSQVRIS